MGEGWNNAKKDIWKFSLWYFWCKFSWFCICTICAIPFHKSDLDKHTMTRGVALDFCEKKNWPLGWRWGVKSIIPQRPCGRCHVPFLQMEFWTLGSLLFVDEAKRSKIVSSGCLLFAWMTFWCRAHFPRFRSWQLSQSALVLNSLLWYVAGSISRSGQWNVKTSCCSSV